MRMVGSFEHKHYAARVRQQMFLEKYNPFFYRVRLIQERKQKKHPSFFLSFEIGFLLVIKTKIVADIPSYNTISRM